MTAHREQIMKRESQQDATIRCLLLTSVSTCFGHHYAHIQEIKGPVTAFGVLFWFCWMWLVAVVGRCLAGCEHYVPGLLVIWLGWYGIRAWIRIPYHPNQTTP